MKSVSTDIETKVLNDLDEKLHGMTQMLVQRPEMVRLLNKDQPDQSPELVFAYYILYTCAYAFHMRQRKVLSDNECEGWLRWRRTTFAKGAIREYWEKKLEPRQMVRSGIPELYQQRDSQAPRRGGLRRQHDGQCPAQLAGPEPARSSKT